VIFFLATLCCNTDLSTASALVDGRVPRLARSDQRRNVGGGGINSRLHDGTFARMKASISRGRENSVPRAAKLAWASDALIRTGTVVLIVS